MNYEKKLLTSFIPSLLARPFIKRAFVKKTQIYFVILIQHVIFSYISQWSYKMWWYYNQNLIYRADYYYCDWHRLKHNHIIDHDMVEHFFIIHIVSWIIFPLICMSVWYLSTDRHRLLCLLYNLFTVTLSPISWSDEYVQTKGKPTQKNEAK